MKKHFNLYTLILSLLFAAFTITGCANLFDENETSLTVTVTFNANDGSESPKTYTQEGPVGKEFSLTPNTFKRAGYEFIGWNKDSTATSSSYKDGGTVSFSESTTLYAIWSSSECTITFNGNGGKTAGGAETSTQKVERNKAVKLTPEIFTRENYVLLGWATDSATAEVNYKTGDAFVTDESITLYAVWGDTTRELQITFCLGETGSDTVIPSEYWKSPYTPPPTFYGNVDFEGFPTLSNFDSTYMNNLKQYFVGWYTDRACSEGKEIARIPAGTYGAAVTFYAKFKSLNLHVSNSGDDSKDGTEGNEVKSLNRAIAIINAANAPDLDWIIYIDDTVSLPSTTDISTSALNANSLTIQGKPGASETPTLSCTAAKVISVTGNDIVEKTITFKNVTITGGNAQYGAGIHVSAPKATVNLSDGCIVSGNTATANGGGVYLEKGKLTLNGGTIKGNTATSCGGGVYVASEGTFELSSGDIGAEGAVNTSMHGGGVYNLGSFSMTGGTINKNKALTSGKQGRGGGVYNAANMSVSGGVIGGTVTTPSSSDYANYAEYEGGGIYNEKGLLSLSNCSVTGNYALSGGGVYTKIDWEDTNSCVTGNGASSSASANVVHD